MLLSCWHVSAFATLHCTPSAPCFCACSNARHGVVNACLCVQLQPPLRELPAAEKDGAAAAPGGLAAPHTGAAAAPEAPGVGAPLASPTAGAAMILAGLPETEQRLQRRSGFCKNRCDSQELERLEHKGRTAETNPQCKGKTRTQRESEAS